MADEITQQKRNTKRFDSLGKKGGTAKQWGALQKGFKTGLSNGYGRAMAMRAGALASMASKSGGKVGADWKSGRKAITSTTGGGVTGRGAGAGGKFAARAIPKRGSAGSAGGSGGGGS